MMTHSSASEERSLIRKTTTRLRERARAPGGRLAACRDQPEPAEKSFFHHQRCRRSSLVHPLHNIHRRRRGGFGVRVRLRVRPDTKLNPRGAKSMEGDELGGQGMEGWTGMDDIYI